MKPERRKIKWHIRCPMCGKFQVIEFYPEDFIAYQKGKLIQNAFPYLTTDEREALKTGICPACWEGEFG